MRETPMRPRRDATEPVLRDLPPAAQDDGGQVRAGLTKDEQAFIDLLRNRTRFGKWAAEVRQRWMASPAGLLAVRRLKGGGA